MKKESIQRWIDEHFHGDRGPLALWIALVLALFFNFLTQSVVGPEIWHYTGTDFTAFYDASKNLWSGQPIYCQLNDPVDLEKVPPEEREPFWGGYVYPSIFAAHMVWVLPFSVFWAKKIYVTVSILVYAWMFVYLMRLFLPNPGPWELFLALLLWFHWGPSIETFRLGQSNTLVTLLFFLAWVSARQGKAGVAGVWLGLAATVKLTPLIMFPLLLVRRQWRTFFFACGVFVVALLVVFPKYNYEYVFHLLPAMERATTHAGQPSIPLLLMDIARALQSTYDSFTPSMGRILVFGLSGLAYLTVLATPWWRGRNWSLADLMLYAVGIMPFFSAKETHHYMSNVLPIFAVFVRILPSQESSRQVKTYLLVALGTILWVPMLYQTHVLSFLWNTIESVTGLPHCDQLLLSQVAWMLILWPWLHRPEGSSGSETVRASSA